MRALCLLLALAACSPSVGDVVLSRGGVAVEVTGDVEAAWSCLPEEARYTVADNPDRRTIECGALNEDGGELHHLGLQLVGEAPLSVSGELQDDRAAALWWLLVDYEQINHADTPGFYEVTEGEGAGSASLTLEGVYVDVAWSGLYPTDA